MSRVSILKHTFFYYFIVIVVVVIVVFAMKISCATIIVWTVLL